ncbi:MAG TPA: hypothetical protein VGM28_07045 [Candidatus Limnocylindrales bacterium]
MEVIRFARALLPLAAITLLGPPGTAGPPVFAVADPPWVPPACRAPVVAGPTGSAAWYRLDEVLDSTGTLSGQRLTVGVVGRRARRVMLPPESFATGPVEGVVLVGDDDGTRSRLRAIDPGRGCATTIAEAGDVIRGAILTPDGKAELEHRVDRATRADLGVWRRTISGGTATRVLPGLAPDAGHGPTFSTDLRWAPDGRLSVASCGEQTCRSRLVDPATGTASATDGTGPVLGVSVGHVIAYAPCDGFPCAILAVDAITGAVDALVPDAGPAAVGGTGDAVLVFEHAGRLVTLDLQTRVETAVPGSDGLAPLRSGSGATAGMDLPRGDVLLAAAGRVPDPSTTRRFNPLATRIEPATEVLP